MEDVGVGVLEIGVGAAVSDEVDPPVEDLEKDDLSFFNIFVIGFCMCISSVPRLVMLWVWMICVCSIKLPDDDR